MGMLINGQWQDKPIAKKDSEGNFIRPDSAFREWITTDGSGRFNAEKDRYHLYVSYACPWASRAIIFRQIKNLTPVISMSTVAPIMLKNGWEFNAAYPDPNYGKQFLYQLYQLANPDYTGKVTVPMLWDKKLKTIVNNESAEIIRMFNSTLNGMVDNEHDYYPQKLQREIDEINEFVYSFINNGVYKCGFASTQTAYEKAFDQLFSALDKIEQRLSQQRYLIGGQITKADWRLFTTLIRFDAVYYGHFKCNLKRISDYLNLSDYLRDLYQQPGIKDTVRFDHIKTHYYASHLFLNPTGIVPKGPQLDLERPHKRHML